jgi:hypothetical protein
LQAADRRAATPAGALRALIDLDNVLVLAFGEALAFLGLILTGMSVRMVEDAKSLRREARELQKACDDFRKSGERAYDEAKQVLREWERRSGHIAIGIRQEPPDSKPH